MSDWLSELGDKKKLEKQRRVDEDQRIKYDRDVWENSEEGKRRLASEEKQKRLHFNLYERVSGYADKLNRIGDYNILVTIYAGGSSFNINKLGGDRNIKGLSKTHDDYGPSSFDRQISIDLGHKSMRANEPYTGESRVTFNVKPKD